MAGTSQTAVLDERRTNMLIRVKYQDNHYDMVRPEVLDHLLEQGKVSEFLRRDGWVSSNSDMLRRSRRSSQSGPDQREKRTVNYRPSGNGVH